MLLPELQRNMDTVCCAALVTDVPGHHQEQLLQTLIVRLFRAHCFGCSVLAPFLTSLVYVAMRTFLGVEQLVHPSCVQL